MNSNTEEYEIEAKLIYSFNEEFGPINKNFLCQSIGCINPNDAILLNVKSSLGIVVDKLKENRIGCIQLVNDEGKLEGIFSERDWILKIANNGLSLDECIEKYMTKNPIAINMQSPIAYAINLMSSGGFRHLPIVDEDNLPIGMLSVKNILDYLAECSLTALLESKFHIENL